MANMVAKLGQCVTLLQQSEHLQLKVLPKGMNTKQPWGGLANPS